VHQQRLALSDARIHVLEEGQKVTDLPRKIALPPPRGPCEKNHPLPLPPPPPQQPVAATTNDPKSNQLQPRTPRPPPPPKTKSRDQKSRFRLVGRDSIVELHRGDPQEGARDHSQSSLKLLTASAREG
jgi:hypothetical protein